MLAEIGRHLMAQLKPVTVRLPAELATQAARAWVRDEEEPAGPETVEQAVVRSFAATLALIGMAVGQDRGAEEDALVTLGPQQVAGCVFAAEHVEERWSDQGDDG